MNIAGKDEELRALSREYLLARRALCLAAKSKVRSQRAQFALKTLMMDEPIKYLEAVVRNDIAGGKSNYLKKQ